MARQGRPSKINEVVRTRTEEGTDKTVDVTAGQLVVEAIGAGNYIETAAKMAGIDKVTLYAWMTKGNAAMARQRLGEELAETEAAYVGFLNAVEQAQAESEAREVAQLAQLARGGQVVRTVTQKVEVTHQADGSTTEKVLERTVREETLAPNAQVIEWRLERRFPTRWGRWERLDVGNVDPTGVPLENRYQNLLEAVRDFREGGEGEEPPPVPLVPDPKMMDKLS